MIHVFPANLALLRAAEEALELIGGFLHARLVRTSAATSRMLTGRHNLIGLQRIRR